MNFMKEITTIAGASLPIDEQWTIRRCRLRSGASGPRICITSGIHGDEMLGQLILYKLSRTIQEHPDFLNGTVDLYPMLNPLGLDLYERMVPAHPRLDMNRAFPGSEDGTPLETMCLHILSDVRDADLILDKEMAEGYILGRIVKTICSAKNLKDLLKAKQMAEEMGLKEDEDFGLINDACFTELNPENENGSTTTAIWFAPLPDEKAHFISKHYQLYTDENSPRKVIRFDSYQSYICPKCKHAIGRFEDFEMLKSKVNYCNICGQKIDWNL